VARRASAPGSDERTRKQGSPGQPIAGVDQSRAGAASPAPYPMDFIERIFTDFSEIHGIVPLATTRR